MNRFDITLKKKPKKKLKKKLEIKPKKKLKEEIKSLLKINSNVGIGTHTVNNNLNEVRSEPIETSPTHRDEVISRRLFPLAHRGDFITNRQGPTSQHLIISGPDGYRMIIPLRNLNYNIVPLEGHQDYSIFSITMPRSETISLQEDIESGMNRVNRNRYG